MSDLLNVVIRIHNADERSLKSLSFCLFTLFGQDYVPLQPIICCQNFNHTQLEKITEVVNESLWDGVNDKPTVPFYPIIHNVITNEKGDFRSKLINEGIRLSTGRYLAFLDYDDLIYGHAYSYLIDRLNKKGTTIAFGNIKRTDVSYLDSFYYQHKKLTVFGHHSKNLSDFFWENFCPIHSFVIDKSKIDVKDLYFDETLSKNEDYHFLLRITAKYKSDFYARYRYVGEYMVRTDGTNTIDTYRRDGDDHLIEWQDNEAYIKELKKDIPVSVVCVADIALLKQAVSEAGDVHELKEKLAAESKSNEVMYKLLCIYFASIVPEDINALPKAGYLESVQQKEEKLILHGWAADLQKKVPVLGLTVIELSTHKPLGFFAPTLTRPDAEAAMQLLQGAFYGFIIELKITIPTYEIAVLSILEDGQVGTLFNQDTLLKQITESEGA